MQDLPSGQIIIEQEDIDDNTMSFAAGVKLPRTITNVRPKGVNSTTHPNFKKWKPGEGVGCKVDMVFSSETTLCKALEAASKESRIKAANTHFRQDTMAEIKALSETALVIDLAKAGRVMNKEAVIAKGMKALQDGLQAGTSTLADLERYTAQLEAIKKELEGREEGKTDE